MPIDESTPERGRSLDVDPSYSDRAGPNSIVENFGRNIADMPTNRISRRGVLKTTGGLLAGVAVLPSSGAAREEGLQITIRQEVLNPEKNGVIPVEVTFPTDTFFPSDTFFPTDTFLGVQQAGVSEAFTIDEGAEETFVSIDDEAAVANPVHVADFGNPHDDEAGLMMHFRSEEIVDYELSDVALGLGVFPDGVDDVVSGDQWDTDTVRIPPRGSNN